MQILLIVGLVVLGLVLLNIAFAAYKLRRRPEQYYGALLRRAFRRRGIAAGAIPRDVYDRLGRTIAEISASLAATGEVSRAEASTELVALLAEVATDYLADLKRTTAALRDPTAAEMLREHLTAKARTVEEEFLAAS